MKLGSEFMPPLYEGTLFYMPVTAPAASISIATDVLQLQDRILKKIPEVSQVFGKAGRAETPTDPAPLEMFETIVNLKPESQWRKGMTVEKLKDEMNDALSIPGVSNSFTMPIKARIDMNATGIRTPVGIKVLGPKLEEIEKIGLEIEHYVKDVPGTRSVYAERITTGVFPRFRHQPQGGCPVWPFRRRCAGSDRVRGGRHESYHHYRRKGTLPRQRPLRPGAQGEHRDAEEGARARRYAGADKLRRDGKQGKHPRAGLSPSSPRSPSNNSPISKSSKVQRPSRANRGSPYPMSLSTSVGETWEAT